MKVDYGAVALIPKGEFDATEQYAVNDLVSYNGSSFIVKAVPPIGTLPTNTAYFAVNASGTSPATSSTVGTVKPDNSTIEVDNDGVISVKSEVLDRVSSSEQALTVNLLNPTSPGGTWSGITVVRNADNSYTISGTNTSEGTITVVFALIASIGFENGKTYRVVGCPSNTPAGVYMRVGSQAKENGEGANFSYPVSAGQFIYISIVAGTVIDPAITIKPMLTTNLSATYDDYVPYSGSSGKLDTDYKALSEKIGNVGNTDLQSQLNAATQSIAQNTTDIAANAAGISALNTGLASKIGTFTDSISGQISDIVWNTQDGAFKARTASDGNWGFLTYPVRYYQGTWLTPAVQNLVIDSVALFGWSRLRTLCINFHFTQQTNLADGARLFNMLSTAPLGQFMGFTRNGTTNQMAQLMMSTDKFIYVHGALQSDATSIWSVQFTYFTMT